MLIIIAGKHRKRRLETLEGKDIRPTSSRVREAIFNIIMHADPAGDDEHLLIDQPVADICCGSGALGLEALSRGAKHTIFIDANQKSLEVARANAEHIGETAHAAFLRADATALPPARVPCSVVFMDPPYGTGLPAKMLASAMKQGWIKPEGMVVIELSAKEPPFEIPEGIELDKERSYGNTKIMIFRCV